MSIARVAALVPNHTPRRLLILTFAAVLALVAVAWLFAPSVQGQVPAFTPAQLQAHLAAGEFGPATAMALAAPPAQRDALLRQIAAAQAFSGARRASLSTASQIANDQVRSGWLNQFNSTPLGGRGGGPQADFDSLIDLITSTIRPDSWEEVGGVGAIEPFQGGVMVNAKGVLQKITIPAGADLGSVRRAATVAGGNRDVRQVSGLRKVSLNRLEKQVQLLWAAGRDPDEAMGLLAGMYEVKYLLVYPETGDVVLAGPAGDWTTDKEGRRVNVQTGKPVLHLDDLVVLLRNAFTPEARFGCSITPTQENLARTKAYLAETSRSPLKPSQREKWLSDLRDKLDRQTIEVYGVDPRSRLARVMVEADYRMKLVGMGLEEGTLGVTSYLDSVTVGPDGQLPPMDVLRWWFTLNYDAVHATTERDAFAFSGQGVKVLSESELLTEQGERVHTGKSNELNSEFAHSFTKHFPQLAAKYPIYAELKNIFDLALVAALIRGEDLPGQVDWHLTHFNDPDQYQIELGIAPTEVDTVINHRLIGGKHIVAGVSGGVTVEARSLVGRDAIRVGQHGLLSVDRTSSAPVQLPRTGWWWD